MKNFLIIGLVVLATVLGTLYFTREKVTSPTVNPYTDEFNETAIKPVSTSSDKLIYSNKGLNELPKEILEQTSATELDLSGNNLTGSLPGEIRFLSKLEVLNVSDNNMTGIPAEIGQLTNLRILNYANNSITGLPNELGNLKNLEIFNLSGNNPSLQDLEEIRAKLPSSVQIIL